MFSKFLYAVSIPSKDAISVSAVLVKLFTTYGVCHTLVSDQGQEFMAQVTRTICTTLGILQQYTPAFVHHCLGACERTHKTLAERITPYVKSNIRIWDDVLQFVLFAMNSSVNNSLGYSPFEVIYGHRLQFPLTPFSRDINFNSIPKDCHSYMERHLRDLDTIRQEIRTNSSHAKFNMETRSTQEPHGLKSGDYVYMSKEPTGVGKKLQDQFAGPLVVHKIHSDHMLILRNPEKDIIYQQPVHISRVKAAYVREPTPSPYFIPSVTTKISQDIACEDKGIQTEIIKHTGTQDNVLPTAESVRPSVSNQGNPSARTIRKPVRYMDTQVSGSESSFSDSKYFKVKKVLAQRTVNDQTQYLVHFSDEPAQNAMWLDFDDLNSTTKQLVLSNPPPPSV